MDAVSCWKLEVDTDRIAWLTCDNPGTSTNVLSAAVLKELHRRSRYQGIYGAAHP
jgi:hypothetical protein